MDESKLLDRAVDLILKQDDLIQSWSGRYIAIQSGIAVAVGGIISWKGPAPGWSVTAVLAMLGVLAIVFAFLLSAVINRHLAWQRGWTQLRERVAAYDDL